MRASRAQTSTVVRRWLPQVTSSSAMRWASAWPDGGVGHDDGVGCGHVAKRTPHIERHAESDCHEEQATETNRW